MKKIEIRNIGPIKKACIDLSDINSLILTGSQASGKSTILKALYLFKSVKSMLFEAMLLNSNNHDNEGAFTTAIASTFRQMFGVMIPKRSEKRYRPFIRCMFYDDAEVTIEQQGLSYNIWISDTLGKALDSLPRTENITNGYAEDLRKKLDEIFPDEQESIFIPAGRSVITVLSDQLGYIFTSMDDKLRSTIDYCTSEFIERILKMKPLFQYGLSGYMKTYSSELDEDSLKRAELALNLADSILKGRYVFDKYGEKLVLEDGKTSIRMNYASSGQQEAVWILNIIFYALLEKKPVCLFIEEPESNLYPDAQMLVAKLLSLVSQKENCFLAVTTHSPYLLGEINNLLYSSSVKAGNTEFEEKFPSMLRWQKDNVFAGFISDGKLKDAKEDGLIRNDLIDGASEAINEELNLIIKAEMNDGK